MYKAKYFLHYNNLYLLQNHRYLLKALIGLIVSLFMSNLSYALATNPGATCPAGSSQGALTNADYTTLVSAVNTPDYVSVAGNASGSIPLQIKMSTVESSTNTTRSNFGVITASGTNAINIRRTFPTPSDFTDVNLEFRNSITTQPIYLTNVALSAFDIDYANSNGNTFDDLVQVTGITQSGSTIVGNFRPIAGSNIVNVNNTLATGLNNSTSTNCPAKDLGTGCQGSIQFTEAINKVTIRYTNNRNFITTSPTNQEIDFRVDNYCYVPQYIFSGTVFDDNGGITAAQASATNADLTTGPYANNNTYFNGVFNPPQETGITGSTVRLVNCTNTSTVYPTQSVIEDNAPVGKYQISIPTSTLGSNTNLCLLETRTGTTYPIRTTSDNRKIAFTATTYDYPNNNFGRVIAENVALVLKKQQYLNDCPSTLNYANINETATPLTGFSTASIDKVAPGKCIAYKITATNRANLNIDSFIMRDILQLKGVNGATVTSVLANPALSTADYAATENPAIGANGEVKTRTLVLNPKTKRDFYFNTKYGTTQ